MTCGIGPVPPVSVSSENRCSFQSKEQPRLRSGSRPSHLNVVLSKAAHSGPSVCLRARALCPLRVSLASERIAQRAVCSCAPCVAADPPSYRLRRSGAYSSRITWACSKGCRPAFRWLLGSRYADEHLLIVTKSLPLFVLNDAKVTVIIILFSMLL